MTDEITLSESEIAKLRSKAQAKVQLELKREVEDKLYAEMVVEERAKFELQEELVSVYIDVPAVNIIDPLSMETGVSINGKRYIHGQTYEVPRSLAGMINHNMFCANRNEAAIGNPNRDYNVRKKVDARNPSAPPIVNTRATVGV
jgi:hypothetical protein